jgi:hypothetical protein
MYELWEYRKWSMTMMRDSDHVKLLLFCDNNNERRGVDDRLSVEGVAIERQLL